MAEKPTPALESAKSLRAKFLRAALRRKASKGVYNADGKLLAEAAEKNQKQLPAAATVNPGERQAWEDHSAAMQYAYLEELFDSAPQAIAIVDSSYRSEE